MNKYDIAGTLDLHLEDLMLEDGAIEVLDDEGDEQGKIVSVERVAELLHFRTSTGQHFIVTVREV